MTTLSDWRMKQWATALKLTFLKSRLFSSFSVTFKFNQSSDTCNNWRAKASKILKSRSIYLQNYNYNLIRKTFEKIYSHSTKQPKKRFQKLIEKTNEELKDSQSEGIASIQKHFDEVSSKNYPLSYTQ